MRHGSSSSHLAARKGKIKAGHTGVPRQISDIAQAMADVGSEGFYGWTPLKSLSPSKRNSVADRARFSRHIDCR
jgi:hypothetical protein